MFKKDRILALDIGASRVVMAEFAAIKTGGLELMSYAVSHLEVDPESDADLPAHVVHSIREIMRQKNIRPGPVLMSISGHDVFPRYVKLPPVSKDKVEQIVRYEAQQNVPFAMDEVVWDYQLIGDEQGDLSVMLVAGKMEVVQRLTDCVEAAGLEPEIVDVSPLALYNALRYNYPDLTGCAMILDIGARTTDVIFAEGNRISTRSIPVAGNAITKELMKEFDLSFKDAEQLKFSHAFVGFGGVSDEQENGVAQRVSKIARSVMTRLHAEVSRTINFYRSQQGGGQPTIVLLTGGSSVIPHANTFLKDKLKVDVDYLNPFRNITVNNAISSDEAGQNVQLLGEVVGVGLRRVLSCPIEINLLPPELSARRIFRRRLPFLGLAAMGLVLTMLVWLAFFQRMSGITAERLMDVKTRVGVLKAVDHQLNGIEAQEQEYYGKMKNLTDLIDARTDRLRMLDQIHGLMPPGMWLTALKPHNPQGAAGQVETMEIDGMGFSDKVKNDAISALASGLTATAFCKSVEIKKIKEVESVNDFVLEMTLK